MKTAYELALERMESQGIEPPAADALTDADRERMAEIRRRAEAKVAELQIYLDQRLATLHPAEHAAESAKFHAERESIEARRDRDLAAVRDAASSDAASSDAAPSGER